MVELKDRLNPLAYHQIILFLQSQSPVIHQSHQIVFNFNHSTTSTIDIFFFVALSSILQPIGNVNIG